ncbi:hypothetical protein C8J56DRAFT_1021484 [Mycena floridula]|nr:hypothetical protein C8J56DRAFT_1021484 [Mycena floridula]
MNFVQNAATPACDPQFTVSLLKNLADTMGTVEHLRKRLAQYEAQGAKPPETPSSRHKEDLANLSSRLAATEDAMRKAQAERHQILEKQKRDQEKIEKAAVEKAQLMAEIFRLRRERAQAFEQIVRLEQRLQGSTLHLKQVRSSYEQDTMKCRESYKREINELMDQLQTMSTDSKGLVAKLETLDAPSNSQSTMSLATRRSSKGSSRVNGPVLRPDFQHNSANYSRIPDRRLDRLTLPVYIPDIETHEILEASFTRKSLSQALGGNHQALVVRATQSKTDLCKTHNIDTYLCPNLDQNPWCPTIPGQHGFMFVGLGIDQHTFINEGQYPLFVGFNTKQSKTREYKYMGTYTAKRHPSLSVDEWKSLSSEVRATYAKTTQSKSKDHRALQRFSKPESEKTAR